MEPAMLVIEACHRFLSFKRNERGMRIRDHASRIGEPVRNDDRDVEWRNKPRQKSDRNRALRSHNGCASASMEENMKRRTIMTLVAGAALCLTMLPGPVS